jgi:hypothetical protein
MGFFSYLKYSFIIFAAHLATSFGAPFENHCLREIGWGGRDWMDLAQDSDQCRALVNTVMNLRVP